MNKKAKSQEKIVQEPNEKLEYRAIAYQAIFEDFLEKTHPNQDTIHKYVDNILAQIPASVYWMNRDYVYLGCTDSMAQLLKLKSREEIIGKTYNDLYDKKSATVYKNADKSVMETGVPIIAEEPLYFPDGSKEIYLSTKVPLRNLEGKIMGMPRYKTW